jgi:peptidoglycan/xylan/chitin deacetylase (PgdA/CDA1 family)
LVEAREHAGVSLKRKLSHALTEAGWLKARFRPPSGLRILLYHAVGSTIPGDEIGLSLPVAAFAEQMRSLAADKRFTPVALGVEALSAKRSVAVTFDDGFADNLTAAAPVLAELGIPFTVFVVPAYVTEKRPLYLTLAQLKELSRVPGCSIGSHGMTHAALDSISIEAAAAELKDSRAWLQDALGLPVSSISYPFGKTNPVVGDLAAEAGYTVGCCSRTAINRPNRDPFMLCRTEIVCEDSLRRFRQKLHGAWDWHRFRRPDPGRI